MGLEWFFISFRLLFVSSECVKHEILSGAMTRMDWLLTVHEIDCQQYASEMVTNVRMHSCLGALYFPSALLCVCVCVCMCSCMYICVHTYTYIWRGIMYVRN